jgi:hypothetical protein
MTLADLHYAAAVRESGRVLAYDSIECLARARRKARGTVSDGIWIADFGTGALHPQSAMTVVRADYPSPMGGGFAAFADPAQARSEAEARAASPAPADAERRLSRRVGRCVVSSSSPPGP